MSLVLIESITREISRITLNNPKRLNVLSKQLIADLNMALDTLEADDQVKCVILTGAGKAFSAGADLAEVQSTTLKDIKENDFIEDWQRLAAFSKPVIAAVNGYAFGGGLELALMTDIIIASNTAQFGQPEIKLSLLPGGGGTQRLTRLIGKINTMNLCLTGESISADKAFTLGLLNKVVNEDELISASIQLAEMITSHSLPQLKMIKQAIKAADELPLKDGMKLERSFFYKTFESPESRKAINAFLSKER